ncbi:MAG TPA: molybdate ABC transporter substrate-binding protein [Rhodanobacteraceae bacterium]|nr:molybdate ABC transporter substrate-binding protein [Rhodanobacteraceae bacterium]
MPASARFRLIALLAVFALVSPVRAEALRLYAAASLKPALDAWLTDPAQAELGEVIPSYAATSALARQIEAGAPADLFIAADTEWMDYLAARGRIVVASRRVLLRNDLVLIAPRTAVTALRIAPEFPLRAALGAGRLALAETTSVPAGRYARAALEHMGVWASVQDRLVATDDVRAALALVARGDVALGVVYHSDAASEPAVREVDRFPSGSHPPIVYPAAIVQGHDGEPARRLLSALSSASARALFARYGFTVPAP